VGDDMNARQHIASLRSQLEKLQTRSLAQKVLISSLLSTLTRSPVAAGVAAKAFDKAVEAALSVAERAKEGAPAYLTVGIVAELERWRDQLASHELGGDEAPAQEQPEIAKPAPEPDALGDATQDAP
jgi:hypothetical protein